MIEYVPTKGTFWMDFTQFLQAFAQVDVCYAYPDWHAKSLPNSFPTNQDKMIRLCTNAYLIQIDESEGRLKKNEDVALYISALQPTKRGNWCRTDRKKRLKDQFVFYMTLPLFKCTFLYVSIYVFFKINFSTHTLNLPFFI